MLARLSLYLLLSGIHISWAIDVYTYPPTSSLHKTLSPEEATAALSRHLGLEAFEPLRDASKASYNEELFVGEGASDTLLLTVEEEDAKAILPPSVGPAFSVETPPRESISSLSSVISTYLHRAQQIYSSVFSAEGPSESLLADVDSLSSFFKEADSPAFAALDLSSLAEAREQHGEFDEEYLLALHATRTFLQRVVDDADVNVAILTYATTASHTYAKREPSPQQTPLPSPNRPPPQEPIGSVSTCFADVDACKNGTNSCSERGQCVKASKSGRTCFVCTCGVTTTGSGKKVKTETWVGQSCERKDISGPFVLFTSTVIALILVAVGSVSLLYSVGDQALPSTLMATAVNAKKD
ncbi:hypothetical protein BDQ12DRAFT_717466 [Crucibulum laeve]|uniref:Vacuolar sorting protein Vps3844 C-terminal domain-containing protein n=1 Tax=Crucibulum laeve TaxID=68775 RepID=A0A5C3MIW4_9AGAR|nr:hypothetical protein BDQ12DRAFT_717466 [Crucibulum laeve]